ncbi:MAG: hypothetical protein ACI85U_001643, partial [Candidatus Promineifilaceae bacterium]
HKLPRQYLFFIYLLIAIYIVFFSWLLLRTETSTIQAATKSIRLETALFQEPYSENQAMDLFENDPRVAEILTEIEHDFIQAVPLAHGEATQWSNWGCWDETCAHMLYYNFSEKGTVEGVVNLERNEVLDVWKSEETRPLASTRTLQKAVEIASQDKNVRSLLGNITSADLMMVPMNIWLLDNDCLDDWCVDLTFEDPAESGKILHVTINMEKAYVARTFYTRGREPVPYRDITPQRSAWTNGCHDEGGWEVCWEMTAHDGIEFFDAKFKGQPVFSSIKIAQVEVWYPAWPGGYRDEIGTAASVPPYFDTNIDTIDGGFRISQLFTEFTRWPNCVCCYRYEEALAFYEDGSFETQFVSHGPGCDDLSIYQPLWRIDLDLKGKSNDEAYVFEDEQWNEVTEEVEMSLIPNGDWSPEGEKLATFDGDLHYRWSYQSADPLGLDEAKLFLVKWNEDEGEIPILTGAANTFAPPRNFIDGEQYSGENITLWYVPLLKTKKGDPWYCMPEPNPEMTPCTAVLRAAPAGALPTAEELAILIAAQEPKITINPIESGKEVAPSAAEAKDTPIPLPTSTHSPLEGDEAETILLNSGCLACHVIGELGDHGKVGPDLTHIGGDAAALGAPLGLSGSEYVRRSIIFPDEHIQEVCPNGPCLNGVMPAFYGERLNAKQLETVVAWLMTQGGDKSNYAAVDIVPVGENFEPSTSPYQPEDNVSLLTMIANLGIVAIAGFVILLLLVVIFVPRFLRNRK